MKISFHTFIFLAMAVATLHLASCKKEKPQDPVINPPISDTPSINLDTVTPVNVAEYKDAITFTISYEDGDGDIGEADADSMTVWLIDNRNSNELIEKYHIAPLVPAGQSITIKGVINLVLNHTAILDADAPTETTTYTIRLRDHAGHWSNDVTSGTVTISR